MTIALTAGRVTRATARASLDAGTSGNTLTDKAFDIVGTKFLSARVPGFPNRYPGGKTNGKSFLAGMRPEPFYDLKAGGNVVSIAQYQDGKILLNNELGQVGAFRIVVSPFAKAFGGAGADNATAIATTLDGAANKLARTFEVASGTSIAVGMKLWVGTEETANTFYPHNEEIEVISISGTTVGCSGAGDNGGLLWDHASGEAVRNADTVYPVLFGDPNSMKKVYAVDIGEYGQLVGPMRQGLAQQWISLAYKWYGNYGIVTQSGLHRGEYATALEA